MSEPSPRDLVANSVVNDDFAFPSEFLVIGGIVTCGLVEVDGFEDERKWTVSEGKGGTGATASYEGHGQAKGSITWTCTSKAECDCCDQVVALLRAALAEDPPAAVSFLDTDTARQGVTAVVATKIGRWTRKEGGPRIRKIELAEYLPEKEKSGGGAPGGVTSKGTSPAGPGADGGETPAAYEEDPALTAAREEYESELAEAKEP